jgi:competence protein ComEC
VPHHGSDTSSSRGLTRAVSAKVALVSAGYRNRWSLPRSEVVRRWRDAGATVLVTAHDGAVGLRLCDKAGIVRLSRNRLERRRMWHEAPLP